MSLRRSLYRALEEPETRAQRAVSMLLALFIILSTLVPAVAVAEPELFDRYARWFTTFELVVLVVFGLEYLVRLAVTPKPLRYVLSFGGIVDLVAIVPSALVLAGVGGASVSFLRALRLLRFLRALKFVQTRSRAKHVYKDTVLAKTVPFMMIFFVLKVAVYILERRGWWVDSERLTEVFAVTGFAIGILLAQKLSVAHERMLAVEDAVIQTTATLTALRALPDVEWEALRAFSNAFERFLTTGDGRQDLRQRTDELMVATNDPDLAWHGLDIAQSSRYAVQRIEMESPVTYNLFLQRVTFFYAAMLIVFLPGIVGLVSVLLASYVLGGMYFVIDDMDRAIGFDSKTLINADLSPLQTFNQHWPQEPLVDSEGDDGDD